MKTLSTAALAAATLLALHPAPGHAQFTGQQAVTAANRVIAPFGYGTVTEVFATSWGLTGNAWCAKTSPASTCLSISGDGDCTWQVGAGTLVSCNQSGKAHVDESRFAPVNCNGQLNGDNGVSGLVTGSDWCGWAGYMARRTTDTLYQYNDYVRLGVNRRFGGAVFELYGTDKLDRIQQNPGGALQMALYGDDLNYAPPGTPSGWFAFNPDQAFLPPNTSGWDNTAYPTQAACKARHPGADSPCRQEMAADNVSDDVTSVGCANNGQDAGAGFNAVQAVSLNCWYGDPNNYVDDVYSPGPGLVSVDKHGPNNYSKSSNIPGLFWAQTSQVIGPFAQLTYDIEGGSTLRTMTPDFQELPAIFLHNGIGALVYYYNGASPYADVGGPVSRGSLASGATTVLGLPTRTGQYGAGFQVAMSEDWTSMCDATATQCVTIASFSNDAQIIQASNNPGGSYFGIHGFFTLAPGLRQRTTLFIAPYRYDDVVAGKSVRQWVYQLRQNQMAPPAPFHGPNY